MRRHSIRFALGLLATLVFSVTAIYHATPASAQGAGGVAAGGIKVVKKQGDLKVGRKYVAVTKTGKVISGTLVSKNAATDSITLKTKNGIKVTVPRKNIEQIREVPKKATAAEKRLAALKKQQEKARQALLARQRQIIVQRAGSRGRYADRPDADPKDPNERIVVLSPRGPIIVQLAVYVDGKPFRMLREAIVDEMMTLDGSKKGKHLKWDDALKDPRFSFSRYTSYLRASSRTAAIRLYDLNKDGFVQRQEVRRFVARLGYGGAFKVQPNYNYRGQPDIKKVLDTNKDGVISPKELKAAPQRLKSRDADDNDLLVPAELGAGTAQGRIRFGQGVRLPTRSRMIFQLGVAANLSGLYNELVKHYGGDKKVVRSAAFRLDPKLFRILDLNKNGILESGEVIGFHLAKPAMKLEIRLGKNDPQGSGVIVKSLAKGLKIDAGSGKSATEHLSVSLPGWKLRIHAQPGTARTYDYTRTAQSYLSRYDTNKNGYIEEKELKKLGATGRYPLQQFKLWDADKDGKVYAKEIKRAFARNLAPRNSQVTLTEQLQGPSLFAALDETGDGRLSLREMRNADKKMLSLDKNNNGRIDPFEMPSEASLTLYRGYTSYYRSRTYTRGRTRTTPVRGPRWFFHMDKNGDGDITMREFLGTKKQFEELDRNGDGFIELKEAEKPGKRAR